ncbi:MAG: hypothetical protein JNL01_00230 [Bdellovibrionales bacterium]|nr:hypothetical protein [Bdellovibrionales bacterium]
MRSKFLIQVACIVTATTSFSACGIFGEKEDLKRTITFNSPAAGCINDLGKKMDEFQVGDVDPEGWDSAFDCTQSALDQFQKFVVGSVENAYTESDLKNLVTNFLVTNRPISEQLISSLLKLKASVIGGPEDRATRAEVERLKDLLGVLKKETRKLIPLLRSRARTPNAADLIQLADAIEQVGGTLAAEIGTSGRRNFSVEDAETLFTELEKAGMGNFPLEWLRAVYAGKNLLFGGGTQTIEGSSWSTILAVGAKAGGLALAMMSLKEDPSKDQMDFRSDLSERFRTILLDAVNRHAGVLRYTDIRAVLDVVPDSVLHLDTMDKVGKTLSRKIVGETLPIIGKRVLESTSTHGLTSASIELAYSLFRQWADADKHLRRIFKQQGLKETGVNIREFIGAATIYQGKIPEADRIVVNRLIQIIQDFPKPLFPNGATEIRFDSSEGHSLTNLATLNTLQLAAKNLLRAYGSLENRTQANLSDLQTLVSELMPIGNDLNFLDPSIPDQARKRFTEANLFTNASDGNDVLDEREITNYLAILVSARGLATRIQSNIEPFCRVQGSDNLQWPWFDGECFRRQYFQDFDIYWENLPSLKMFYKNNAGERALIENSIRVSSKKPDAQGQPGPDDIVGNFVIQGYALIIQYVESMFMRYDGSVGGRLDQFLDEDEVMVAYPVFYKTFADRVKAKKLPFGLSNNKNFVKAVFTWTIKHGHEPGDKDLLSIAVWFIGGQNSWNVQASRANIYSIIPGLNQPQ